MEHRELEEEEEEEGHDKCAAVDGGYGSHDIGAFRPLPEVSSVTSVTEQFRKLVASRPLLDASTPVAVKRRTLEFPLELTEAEHKANEAILAEIVAAIAAAAHPPPTTLHESPPPAPLASQVSAPTPASFRATPRDPEAKESIDWAWSLLEGSAAQQEHGVRVVAMLISSAMEGRYRPDLFAEGQAGSCLVPLLFRIAGGGGDTIEAAKAQVAAVNAIRQLVSGSDVDQVRANAAALLVRQLKGGQVGTAPLSGSLLFEASALENNLRYRGLTKAL